MDILLFSFIILNRYVIIFLGGIVMEINELKQNIEKILSCKEIKNSQYKAAFKMLDTIKDDVSVRECYDNYMGKLLLRQGNLASAKYYFLDQLSVDAKSCSAHYNLYKISVYQGNFNEALMNLEMYMGYVDNENNNVELPYSMLKMYIDLVKEGVDGIKSVEMVDSTDYYADTVIKDAEALELYNKLIDAFNKKNMKAVNNYLEHLDVVIKRKKLNVDISPLKVVAKVLDNKLKNVCIQSLKEDPGMLKTNVLDYNMASICIYNNYVSPKKALNMIDKLVSRDPVVAGILLGKFSEHYPDVSKDSVEVSYLRNKINEKKQYIFLSQSDKTIYDMCITKGREEYDKKEYYNALNYYQAAALVTEHPIFSYYIGKILYKIGKLDESYEYMRSYEARGGEKELHSLLYLRTIDAKMKRRRLANERENKSDKLVNYFQSNRNWCTNRKKQVSKQDLNINRIDLKKVKFNDGDLFGEQSNLINLNDICFEDKLSIIKQLYQGDQIDLADFLASKIECFNDSSNEKQIPNIQKQNGKLYTKKRNHSNHN